MPAVTCRSCWADCNAAANRREQCRLPFLLPTVSFCPFQMEYCQRFEIPFLPSPFSETRNASLFDVLRAEPTCSRCEQSRLRERTKIRRMTRVPYIKKSNPDGHQLRRRFGRV